jgi:hypothetical protein
MPRSASGSAPPPAARGGVPRRRAAQATTDCPDISEGLCALAEFAAVARSPIHFDYRGEIDYIPEPEGPACLVKQLALMSQALSLVRAEPETSLTTYVTACAVAQDTLPA